MAKYSIEWIEAVKYSEEVEAESLAEAYEKWLKLASENGDLENVSEQSLKIKVKEG